MDESKKMTDYQIESAIDKLVLERSLLSEQITKLRRRLNARRHLAHKKAALEEIRQSPPSDLQHFIPSTSVKSDGDESEKTE